MHTVPLFLELLHYEFMNYMLSAERIQEELSECGIYLENQHEIELLIELVVEIISEMNRESCPDDVSTRYIHR